LEITIALKSSESFRNGEKQYKKLEIWNSETLFRSKEINDTVPVLTEDRYSVYVVADGSKAQCNRD
jgi:hypothetical protein